MTRSIFVLSVVAASFLAGTAVAQTLVTAEEAALPPAKGAISVATRGITRGPKIEYVAATGQLHSPTTFTVRFESFGGAAIDMTAVKVTYLRTPTVDLTPRLKPFLQPTGIAMPNAELPPGDHLFRIDIADTGGRTATANVTLKIAP